MPGGALYLTPELIPQFDLYLSFTGGPVLDELRLNGSYERLAQRAQRKRQALAGFDLDAAPAQNTLALRLWYFEERLGRALPEDIETYSHELGFTNLANFDSALRRERIYFLRHSADDDPDNLT